MTRLTTDRSSTRSAERLRDLLRGVRGLLRRHRRHAWSGYCWPGTTCTTSLALLRGARTGQPVADRLAAVMGVGALDQRAAADLAAAPDGATAVLRLAAHRLPDPVDRPGASGGLGPV